MIHHLKTINPYFQQVWSGKKKAELRFNDRNFQVGNTIVLQEYLDGSMEFSGREIVGTITNILENAPQFGLKEGFCLISFAIIKRKD